MNKVETNKKSQHPETSVTNASACECVHVTLYLCSLEIKTIFTKVCTRLLFYIGRNEINLAQSPLKIIAHHRREQASGNFPRADHVLVKNRKTFCEFAHSVSDGCDCIL